MVLIFAVLWLLHSPMLPPSANHRFDIKPPITVYCLFHVLHPAFILNGHKYSNTIAQTFLSESQVCAITGCMFLNNGD